MWIVCYVNEKNRNEWTTIEDDADLFLFLDETDYFDGDGNLRFEDLYIFRESQVMDPEQIYRKVKRETEANM